MSMTEHQEVHLFDLKKEFAEAVDKKYRAGQAEHGGDLWDQSFIKLLDAAIDEAVDQFVYLSTLKMKLRRTTYASYTDQQPVDGE